MKRQTNETLNFRLLNLIRKRYFQNQNQVKISIQNNALFKLGFKFRATSGYLILRKVKFKLNSGHNAIRGIQMQTTQFHFKGLHRIYVLEEILRVEFLAQVKELFILFFIFCSFICTSFII